MNLEENKLDLSGQCFKKIPKSPSPEIASRITALHFDNNELKSLENISQFPSVVELSATHNQVPRMPPVGQLQHLVRLDLSHNNIILMEGLRKLAHLTYLNLSSNRIKSMDHLNTNLQLEHLDLSENQIMSINNISQLVKLKQLYLHKNMIVHLRHCEVFLPSSLETLTLAGNKIADLNEVSHLVNLTDLRYLSIVANPCVQMTGNKAGYDYRPFLLNWCTGLKCIDGFAVDDIESLKGEWLYSQGRGRQFRPGEHAALVQYLLETCPLNNQILQSENERKLRLILRKTHYHHQSQLRISEQRGSGSGKSFRGPVSELMSRSLDSTLQYSCSTHLANKVVNDTKSDHVSTRSLHCEPVTNKKIEKMTSNAAPASLHSKIVPVPKFLISPMVTNTPPLVVHSNIHNSDIVSPCKLQTFKNKSQENRVKRVHANDREQAAICIQKMWRGYHTRNLNSKVLSLYQHLQTRRTYQYIQKLSADLEATRAALDSEHKLRLLQMQAINALWKKVVSSQPAKLDESIGKVKDLDQTCDRLNAQVQQLHSCMQEVLRCVSLNRGSAIATQTDIITVPTPSSELSERKFLQNEPSSLPISVHRVQQYTDGSLVGVIKKTVNSKDKEPVAVLEDESTLKDSTMPSEFKL